METQEVAEERLLSLARELEFARRYYAIVAAIRHYLDAVNANSI
jgi:hypothetical protein